MKIAQIASPTTFFLLSARTARAFAPRFAQQQARFSSAMATATEPSSVADSIKDNELFSTINDQITNELAASQLYLSASIWCERQEWVGMAAYMRSESDEERSHALSFVDFCNKRHFPLQMQPLDAPSTEWNSVVDLWESLLKAEQENTEALKKLDNVANDKKDTALSTFLDPFHMEQVESENSLRTILAKARDMEETPGLLRQLDNELGERASSGN